MKTCNKCLNSFPKDHFYNKSQASDGLNTWCKSCCTLDELRRSRTRIGLVNAIYKAQRKNSGTRGHKPPSYTKRWLQKFVMQNKDFSKLYNAWVDSNYKSNLRPSIDRIDNSKSYTEDNIQLTTFQCNRALFNRDRAEARNGAATTQVDQYDLDGQFIASFGSIKLAATACNVGRSHISNCLTGVESTCGGFLWVKKGEQAPTLTDYQRRNAGKTRGRKVNKYNLTTKTLLCSYPTVREAERQTGICEANIRQVCTTVRRKQAGGFMWRYA